MGTKNKKNLFHFSGSMMADMVQLQFFWNFDIWNYGWRNSPPRDFSYNDLSGGGSTIPPLPTTGVGTWCSSWGEQLGTGGAAVYISSIQHTEKIIWKENYVALMTLDATACQCMSLDATECQGFPNSIEWWGIPLPSSGEEWKILLREFNLYGGGNLRRSDFDHLNLFQS